MSARNFKLARSLRLVCSFLVIGSFGVGLSLLRDRPGLRAEYFPLSSAWSSDFKISDISMPQLSDSTGLASILVSRHIFSLRWHGWLEVSEAGVYSFQNRSDRTSYLEIDGQRLYETEDQRGQRLQRATRQLEAGFHPIEIGYSQAGGSPRLKTFWRRPDREWEPLLGDALYSSRPSGIRLFLRKLLGGWDVALRRFAGCLILALTLALSTQLWSASRLFRSPWLIGLQQWPSVVCGKRTVQICLGAVLFMLTYRWVLPLTGATADGDDIRYLYAAAFAKKMGWIVNRYAHVYLLRGFIALQDGDAFLGSRVYWSCMFAVAVVAIAAAVRSLGKGLQLRTLMVALILLFSQPAIFGGIGIAYADYTAMMFITIAVAAYLHGQKDPTGHGRPWHFFLIGALTVAAIKSKEIGLILLWLPLLFAWTDGRLDRQRFFQRLKFWMAGGFGAYLILMVLDAWILGDFFFSLRPETLSGMSQLRGASEGKSKWGSFVWLDVIWSGYPRNEPVVFALRHLGMMVILGAISAFAMKARMELRLLRLMPLAYVGLLMAIHPAFPSTRFLIPIIPIACLCGAMFFGDFGLESLRWRDVLGARLLVPIVTIGSLVGLIIVPLRQGWIGGGEVGMAANQREIFSQIGKLVEPWAVFSVLLLIGLLVTKSTRKLKLTVLLICFVGFFAGGAVDTWESLDHRLSVQRGDLILYPWTAFSKEIVAAQPRRLTVSRSVVRKYGMSGQKITRSRIARLFFRRGQLRVDETEAINPGLECVIGDQRDYREWYKQMPGLGATATIDRSGRFVLVTPRQVGLSGQT